MAIVESSIEIDSPLEKVYALAKNIEAFPEFMPDVESVRILERSDDNSRTISDWVGVVKEFRTKIRWTEEDVWDDQAKTCTFNMVKGDYSKYSGKWTFIDLGDRTRFDSQIEVEYEIPLVGALIKNIIAKKMKENVDNILSAVKFRAESEA